MHASTPPPHMSRSASAALRCQGGNRQNRPDPRPAAGRPRCQTPLPSAVAFRHAIGTCACEPRDSGIARLSENGRVQGSEADSHPDEGSAPDRDRSLAAGHSSGNGHGCACSKAAAARSTSASSPRRPTICRPTGSPSTRAAGHGRGGLAGDVERVGERRPGQVLGGAPGHLPGWSRPAANAVTGSVGVSIRSTLRHERIPCRRVARFASCALTSSVAASTSPARSRHAAPGRAAPAPRRTAPHTAPPGSHPDRVHDRPRDHPAAGARSSTAAPSARSCGRRLAHGHHRRVDRGEAEIAAPRPAARRSRSSSPRPRTRPRLTSSNSAASATLRAIGPCTDSPELTGRSAPSPRSASARTRRTSSAGMRIEPAPSPPWCRTSGTAAAAAAAPPLDPPARRRPATGSRWSRARGSVVSPFQPHSGVAVLPRITAPAARTTARTARRPLGHLLLVRSEPPVVRTPARSSRSLIVTGMPASGPAVPSAYARSAAAAPAPAPAPA